MSIITLDPSIKLDKLVFGQRRYDMNTESADTGISRTRLLGPPRWTAALTSMQDMTPLDARGWEGLVISLRGRVNHLALWDVGKPAPLGTMRGVMSIYTAAVSGDTTVYIDAGADQALKTLLMGDWLQIGTGLGTSQLVKVMADCAADGSGKITVPIEPPLRIGYAAPTQVTWDKPLAYFKATASDTTWTYQMATQGSFALDMLEQWV